jgi:glyoxylase-like metal-dependent hydrolase (beta-lactamase superfamily II)
MSITSLQNDMKNYAAQTKEVAFEKVTDEYFFVKAFGNVGIVVTNEGIVVIDSTISPNQAESILTKIREVTDQPIRYLVYTHGHGDHVGGASVFKREGAQIIAHRNVITRLDKYKDLNRFQYLINERQFATNFKANQLWDEAEYPDIVYDHEYVFSLGGKTFHLIHGKGETDDHTIIHVPEDDVVFTGDFMIRSFPNVGNPAKDMRFAKEWAQMMDKIRSLQPKITFPGHGPYIDDPVTFDDHTKAIKESMEFVHESVVNGLNEGKSLDEIVENTKLPVHLKDSPYLAQFYGCLDFAIRGTYRRYTGWYDGNPTNLYPEKSGTVSTEINSLIADEEKIINRSNELVRLNKHQLALHLLDIIIESEGKLVKEAKNLKAEIVAHLSEVDDNYMRKNIYNNASKVIFGEIN